MSHSFIFSAFIYRILKSHWKIVSKGNLFTENILLMRFAKGILAENSIFFAFSIWFCVVFCLTERLKVNCLYWNAVFCRFLTSINEWMNEEKKYTRILRHFWNSFFFSLLSFCRTTHNKSSTKTMNGERETSNVMNATANSALYEDS